MRPLEGSIRSHSAFSLEHGARLTKERIRHEILQTQAAVICVCNRIAQYWKNG
jgi:hypothetical protein